jgi:RNA polymerase sigma-70 factor (ECF subfamily)
MTWAASIGAEDDLNAESAAINRLRKGDLDSLSELVPRYERSLYRYLYRLVSDLPAAEDLFQDTWLRAAQNIGRYDPARSFQHWLFSIAHNVAIDYLRRRRPEALLEERVVAETRSALDELLEAERGAELSHAVNELPAMYREVLTLRFQEELKLEEIAQIIAAPLGTVKTRLQRSLQHLRARFL